MKCWIEQDSSSSPTYKEISYSIYETHPNSCLFQSSPQKITIRKHFYSGFQHCLFKNFQKSNSIFNYLFQDSSPSFGDGTWNVEYYITNPSNEIKITVAGTPEAGIIPYIERFGFYEGNKYQNPYSISVDLLVGLLTGLVSQEIIEFYERFYEKKRETIETELKVELLEIEQLKEQSEESKNESTKEKLVWMENANNKLLEKLKKIENKQSQKREFLTNLFKQQQ